MTDQPAASDTPPRRGPISSLIGGSVVYGLGTVLVQLINILLLPLLTAYLEPAQYGEVAVLNFTALVLISVFSVGVTTTVGMLYFDQKVSGGKDALVWSSVLLVSVASLFLCGIITVAPEFWAETILNRGEAARIIVLLALSVSLTIIALPFDCKLRLDQRPFAFVLASLITTLAVGGVTLWFVIGLDRGVLGYFEAQVIGRFISVICFGLLAMRGARFSVSVALIRTLVLLGLPIVPQFAFLYFLQFGNVELLKRWVGLEAAGIYSIGLTIGLASNVIISSIANAWMPFFLSYQSKAEEAGRIFGDVAKYYVLGVGCITFTFFYFAQILITVLASAEYASASQVVGLTATAIFVLGFYNILLPPIYAAKLVGRLIYMLIIAVAVQIALGIFLIPHFGIVGAALTMIGAYIALDCALLVWNSLYGRTHLRIIFDWPRIIVFLAYFSISVTFFTWIPPLPILRLVQIYLAHFALSICVSYCLLDSSEKRQAWGFLASLWAKASQFGILTRRSRRARRYEVSCPTLRALRDLRVKIIPDDRYHPLANACLGRYYWPH